MNVKIIPTLLAMFIIMLTISSATRRFLFYAMTNVMIGLSIIILTNIFYIYYLKKRRSSQL